MKQEQRGYTAAEAPREEGRHGGETAMRSLMSLKKVITMECWGQSLIGEGEAEHGRWRVGVCN